MASDQHVEEKDMRDIESEMLLRYLLDSANGEKAVAQLDGIDVSEFCSKSRLLITDRRIWVSPPPDVKLTPVGSGNPDAYYHVLEFTDFRDVATEQGLFGNSIKVTFKNGSTCQLKGPSEKLGNLAYVLRALAAQAKPLIQFPDDETVLLKSGPGISCLPSLGKDFRREVFWDGTQIRMAVTDRRIVFYRVQQLDQMKPGYSRVGVRFGRPRLQFACIPIENVLAIAPASGRFTGVTLTLNTRLVGYELLSLRLYPVGDLVFHQYEYSCAGCGRSIKGQVQVGEPKDTFTFEGYGCASCKSWLCSDCAKPAFFSRRLACPKCGEKEKPAYFITATGYRVIASGQVAEALPAANSKFNPLPVEGKEGREWNLEVCEKKWAGFIVPAVERAMAVARQRSS
ncbi:MAG: hypothetical protein ACYC5J_14625 [Chloroflexota bacterium]